MSFFTSLSGLRGAQTDLNTVSNNVANVGTHGFKRSRAEFGDLMPPSRTTPGMGTKLKGLQQVFSQGGFEATTRNLDMAISGPGFFLTRDSLTGGQSQFTRAGSFAINADRYLVDSNNAYVQVLPVDASGNLVSRTLAAARNLQLPLTSGIPRATSLIDLAVSLPSSADKPSARSIYGPSNPYAFDRADPNSFNFQQQTTVYDASGQAFPATLYFTRSASTAAGDADNRWQVNAFIGDASATSTPIELVFDSTGALTSPTGPQALDSITPPTASAPLSISLDFGTATLQSTGTFNVAAIDQDGIASARFQDVGVGSDGLITATFSDGTTQPLGQLLVANFSNPGGLKQLGNARWQVTGDSGAAQIGVPGEDGFGSIQTGALEQANVDITEELVALIAAQRNFQANARAIETANEMTQTVVNLRT